MHGLDYIGNLFRCLSICSLENGLVISLNYFLLYVTKPTFSFSFSWLYAVVYYPFFVPLKAIISYWLCPLQYNVNGFMSASSLFLRLETLQ